MLKKCFFLVMVGEACLVSYAADAADAADAAERLNIISGVERITEDGEYQFVRVATADKNAFLVISNGANVSTTEDLSVGYDRTSSYEEAYGGAIIRDGAKLNIGNHLQIGASQSGGLLISGANTSVIAKGKTEVAYHEGNGALFIADGATLTNEEKVNGHDNAIAVGAGSTGYVSIKGTGSTWSVANLIKVGDGGNGTMTLSDGGTMQADQIILGNNGGEGTLNIGAAYGQEAVTAGIVNANSIVLNSNNSNSSQIILNHTSDDFTLNADISGVGSLYLYSGTSILEPINSTNSYQGYTVIEDAVLRAGSEGAFSGNSEHYVGKEGELDLNGFSQTTGTLNNSGTIYMNQSGTTAGTELTVNGDYHGYDGTLVFNSVLEGDDSVTDTLHVLGNADGSTNVQVNNLGGKGAQTIEGIELISIDGSVAAGTEFKQSGRIVAGAYDYRLVQGGDSGNNNSWYLTSGQGGIDPIEPVPPVDPGPEPVPPVDPGPEPVPPTPPTPPTPPSPPEVSTSRPEAGSYVSNLAATEMFISRLEDRGGEHVYTDAITGERKTTTMWLRSEGRHVDSRDSSGQIDTRENRYTVQLGGDIANGSFSDTDTWRLGAMTGYGNSHSKSSSELTGYRSEADVDGYTLGLYGTWFANSDRRTGLWVDTWLQYAFFDNSVKGEGLADESYDSDGLQASVESGYTFRIKGDKKIDYFIEPQVQVVWNGVKMDEHREVNGTKVSGTGENNIHTRLGLRAGMEIQGESDVIWKPYAAVNWHNNTENYGVQMDDIKMSSEGTKNIGEVKLGVEGKLTSHLSVWGNTSAQLGTNDYRNTGGMLGVKYNF